MNEKLKEVWYKYSQEPVSICIGAIIGIGLFLGANFLAPTLTFKLGLTQDWTFLVSLGTGFSIILFFIFCGLFYDFVIPWAQKKIRKRKVLQC